MADNHASGSLRSSSGKGERDIMPRPLSSLISVTRRASPYEFEAAMHALLLLVTFCTMVNFACFSLKDFVSPSLESAMLLAKVCG